MIVLQVDWNWWVVFIPAWLIYAGRLVSWFLNKALAFYLAHEIKELEHCSEVRRDKRRAAFFFLSCDSALFSSIGHPGQAMDMHLVFFFLFRGKL